MNHQTALPTVSLDDDADLAAEAGQRIAAAAQTAQQVFNNWVLYEQRKEKQNERGQRGQTGHERSEDRQIEWRSSASQREHRADQRQGARDMNDPAPAGAVQAPGSPTPPADLRLVTDERGVDFEQVLDPARVEQKMRLLDPDGSITAATADEWATNGGNVVPLLPDGQDAVVEYLVGNRLAAQEDYLIGNKLVAQEEYLQAPNPLAASIEVGESPSPGPRLAR